MKTILPQIGCPWCGKSRCDCAYPQEKPMDDEIKQFYYQRGREDERKEVVEIVEKLMKSYLIQHVNDTDDEIIKISTRSRNAALVTVRELLRERLKS